MSEPWIAIVPRRIDHRMSTLIVETRHLCWLFKDYHSGVTGSMGWSTCRWSECNYKHYDFGDGKKDVPHDDHCPVGQAEALKETDR